MNATTLKLRVGTDELAKWKAEAKSKGLTLSAWIRRKCNPPAVLFEAQRDEMLDRMQAAVTHPENPGAKYYHTATSNRLTCMCETCTEYRQRHDIPLGGFK
jgi:hypothetical protein